MINVFVVIGALFMIIGILASYVRLNFHLKIENIRRKTQYKGFARELLSLKNIGISTAFIIPWRLNYSETENDELQNLIVIHNRIASVIAVLIILGFVCFGVAAVLLS